jgi:protein TonB
MKTLACFVLLSAILVPGLLAQTQANSGTQQPYEIQISAGVAEKLLIHKVEPVWSQTAMEARGTVVVIIEIGKNGDVLSSKVISGPSMLSNPVLDAIRKYKYKPFILNGETVEVETTVYVTKSN